MNANLTIGGDYQTVDRTCMPVKKIPSQIHKQLRLLVSIEDHGQYYFPPYPPMFDHRAYLNSLVQDLQYVHDYLQIIAI